MPVDTDGTCSISVRGKQYVPNTLGEESLCGTALFPWHVYAEEGQRLRIFLIDFLANPTLAYQDSENSVPVAEICQRSYGKISESSTGEEMSFCGGQRREQEIYTSTTNSVRVELNFLESKNFMLYVKGMAFNL